MKLLFENWRRYLKEQHEDDFDDDEDDDNGDIPKTPAGKVVSLLITGDIGNGLQAREFMLAGLADIDEVLDILIEHLLSLYHNRRKSGDYRSTGGYRGMELAARAAKSYVGFLGYNSDDRSKRHALSWFWSFRDLVFNLDPNKENHLEQIDGIHKYLKKKWENSLQ